MIDILIEDLFIIRLLIFIWWKIIDILEFYFTIVKQGYVFKVRWDKTSVISLLG